MGKQYPRVVESGTEYLVALHAPRPGEPGTCENLSKAQCEHLRDELDRALGFRSDDGRWRESFRILQEGCQAAAAREAEEREGMGRDIAVMEAQLERSEAHADRLAEIIKSMSMSGSGSHDGYTKVVHVEHHFEAAAFTWALVREDELHVAAVRQDDPDGWVISFAKNDHGWYCEGDSAGLRSGYIMPIVSSAVIAYVEKHGVPS